MDSGHSTSWSSFLNEEFQDEFLLHEDQERLDSFFDFSRAAAEPTVSDPGVLERTSDPVPGYTDHMPHMQDPLTSLENYAPELLAPNNTQWHPMVTPRTETDGRTFSDITLHFPIVASSSEEPGTPVTHYDHGAPRQLGQATGNYHGEVQLRAGYETAQIVPAPSPSTDVFHCGLHGCQFISLSEDLLARHQRFHALRHWVVSESPFKCKCGKTFTKLHSLERHIQGFLESGPKFPCQERGCRKGFKRKDHLVQHMSHTHHFSDTELRAKFPNHRQVIRNTIPVCPFSSCPDHRGEDFERRSNEFREANKPFAKQSDYTRHMKIDHDWSPYPCTVASCDKRGKNGYFSLKALQKHYQQQHPDIEEPEILSKIVA
ncbi:hypothetical protein PG988_007946 [Apiospora saccharicola]